MILNTVPQMFPAHQLGVRALRFQLLRSAPPALHGEAPRESTSDGTSTSPVTIAPGQRRRTNDSLGRPGYSIPSLRPAGQAQGRGGAAAWRDEELRAGWATWQVRDEGGAHEARRCSSIIADISEHHGQGLCLCLQRCRVRC